MIKAGDVSLAMVRSVAERLGPLRQKAVFLGGAATALLITDEATPEVRATKDVDIIVEVLSKSDYYQLEDGRDPPILRVYPVHGRGCSFMPMGYK